jgi:hypothetical protein
MIDKNLQTSYIIVDHMHKSHPELLKDRYWNELPKSLPDRAKTFFQEETPRQVNDADIVNYSEPRVSDTRQALERTIDASYMVVKVKEPNTFVPDSSKISSVYQHLENVEQEQNLINLTIERIKHEPANESPLHVSFEIQRSHNDDGNSSTDRLESKNLRE